MESALDIIHKIRNCLGSLQTFLEVVNTDREDPKIQRLQQTCRENITQIGELLKKLEV